MYYGFHDRIKYILYSNRIIFSIKHPYYFSNLAISNTFNSSLYNMKNILNKIHDLYVLIRDIRKKFDLHDITLNMYVVVQNRIRVKHVLNYVWSTNNI